MEKLLSESDKIIIFFCTDKYISYVTSKSQWIIYNIELKSKYIVPIYTINGIAFAAKQTWITDDNKYALIIGSHTLLLRITDNSVTVLTKFHNSDGHYRVQNKFMYIPEKHIFYITVNVRNTFTNVSRLYNEKPLYEYNPETRKDIFIANYSTLVFDKINHNNKTYLVSSYGYSKHLFYDTNTFTANMNTLIEIKKPDLCDKLLNKYNEFNKNINKQRHKYYEKKIYNTIYSTIHNTIHKYIDYFNGDIIYKKFSVDTPDSFQLDYETNTIYSTHDNAIYKFDICKYFNYFYTLLNDYHIPPEIQNIILKYI